MNPQLNLLDHLARERTAEWWSLLRQNSLAYLQHCAHEAQVTAGWWTDMRTGADMRLQNEEGKPGFNVAEKLCLIHSEVSEALEGHRKGMCDTHLPHRPAIEVELADALIRILDLAGGLQLDLAGAFVEKMAYNAKRADHKLAERQKEGGKAF